MESAEKIMGFLRLGGETKLKLKLHFWTIESEIGFKVLENQK